MISSPATRAVVFNEQKIIYQLEQKQVKNLNLRIRKDGTVYVSANDLVPVSKVDEFVVSKGAYILSALQRFQELAQYRPQAKQYISGETFYVVGRGLRLKVSEASKEGICTDGAYIFLNVKDASDTAHKERIMTKYLDQQCKEQFGEIMAEIYPTFQKYGVGQPVLRIRNMDTRWGSCLAKKGIVTLNKRLLEAPRNCIEYVVMHEFCHFIHSNHSSKFYSFLTMLMPDWKQRKETLDKSAAYWL
ncbi:MAG: SprT family zinc-dependent metalloprotease [Oscillospiraceae bacterium]|nr:SprT family zinc-dependent metalloprotease [Oscillospiraceae bacterium]